MNHIDTAAFYFSSSARANDVIRAGPAPYPDDLTIVTAVGPGWDLSTGEWDDWLLPVVNYRSNGRDDVPAAVSALADPRHRRPPTPRQNIAAASLQLTDGEHAALSNLS